MNEVIHLLKALRALAMNKHSDHSIADDAADEIVRLRARVEEMNMECSISWGRGFCLRGDEASVAEVRRLLRSAERLAALEVTP